jgi:hypothetical protein
MQPSSDWTWATDQKHFQLKSAFLSFKEVRMILWHCANAPFLRMVPFDIISDDASHIGSVSSAFFKYLFPHLHCISAGISRLRAVFSS